MQRDNPVTIGIVLDVSFRHFRGKRIVDLIKQSLIGVIKHFADDDIGYFYDYNNTKCLNRGKFLSAISGHEPFNLELEFAMKQTLYVVSGTEADNDKFIIYISDRYSKENEFALRKVVQLNKKDCLGCYFIFCGFGDQYDKESMESLKENKVEVFDFSVIENMESMLLGVIENEETHLYTQPDV